ncbi:adenine/guanine permease AZG1-like [Elaeis guineensis]|uniref:adenine/guanine permease AZG1-like n=1 Tax=Elaeis guineensis var. tenera TaxID=51953 RepID=UPI003C6CDBBB
MAKSWFGKQLKLSKWGSTFTTEIHAGTTTFLTMAYILADFDAICSIFNCDNPMPTYKFSLVDLGYAAYLECIHRDLIVCHSCLLHHRLHHHGRVCQPPPHPRPGMGANAYFAYTIVSFHGFDNLSYGSLKVNFDVAVIDGMVASAFIIRDVSDCVQALGLLISG